MCCYWFRRGKCIGYTSIPQAITSLVFNLTNFAKLYKSRFWRYQCSKLVLRTNQTTSVQNQILYQCSKLVRRVSNANLFIIIWYYRSEKTISSIFSFLYHSIGNGAVQNKLYNKRLGHNYLGKLFDATFSKYSNLNSKHKYVRPNCIISITRCSIAFTRIWSNLIIMHLQIFLWVHSGFGWNTLELSYKFAKAENQTRPHRSERVSHEYLKNAQ